MMVSKNLLKWTVACIVGFSAQAFADSTDFYADNSQEPRSFDLTDGGEPENTAPAPAQAYQPDNNPHPAGTVEQQLQTIIEARKRGELTGEEYLAERRRIIYGQ